VFEEFFKKVIGFFAKSYFYDLSLVKLSLEVDTNL